jgi:hypothetical protein
MRLSRLVRAFAVTGLLTAGAACDAQQPHQAAPDDYSDVLYVGATTDEALSRLLDLAPRDDAARRVVVDTPAAGAALDCTGPAPISFHPAVTAALELRRRPVARAGRPRLGAELAALLGPIRRAHAHGTPFNGTGYFLAVTDHAGQHRLRVFTDRTSYTPGGDVWSALCAAPRPLQLTITWAAFEANAIPDGGGPFVGATIELGRR